MDLVIDIGNYRWKGAYFEEDQVVDSFVIPPNKEILHQIFEKKKPDHVFASSVNGDFEQMAREVVSSFGLIFQMIDYSTVKVELDVEEPDELGQDRIANVYGALFHFPQNDCIVVDLGTAVTFDFIVRTGKYLGGAIYPGMDIGANALDKYTDKLPLVEIEKPPTAVAKTTKTHIQSGLYWGLLGAIERITFEMRITSPNPSNVKVLATGGLLLNPKLEDFAKDLSDLVDVIDPQLTLIGIHEIMKENK